MRLVDSLAEAHGLDTCAHRLDDLLVLSIDNRHMAEWVIGRPAHQMVGAVIAAQDKPVAGLCNRFDLGQPGGGLAGTKGLVGRTNDDPHPAAGQDESGDGGDYQVLQLGVNPHALRVNEVVG